MISMGMSLDSIFELQISFGNDIEIVIHLFYWVYQDSFIALINNQVGDGLSSKPARS